jgi:predicted NAD/FAD-dependent oxidoreductase
VEDAKHPRRVAVVGAGLAGLTAASTLQAQGHDVVLVEKARGPGGRMATRRHESWQFDHGAQYFTAREMAFRERVAHWCERGLVQRWTGRIGVVEDGKATPAPPETERYVAVPRMSVLCGDLAATLADCRFEWRAHSATYADTWQLRSDDGRRVEADGLLLAIPPEQALALLTDPASRRAVRQALDTVVMEPCWALLAVLDRPLLREWDAAFVNQGPLGWVCSQAAKPDRPPAPAWVLHATTAWSRAQLKTGGQEIAALMLDAARQLPGANPFEVAFAAPHRWLYSQAHEPLDAGALWFPETRLALAGDWCAGSRVEGAFLSGLAAAAHIAGRAAG